MGAGASTPAASAPGSPATPRPSFAERAKAFSANAQAASEAAQAGLQAVSDTSGAAAKTVGDVSGHVQSSTKAVQDAKAAFAPVTGGAELYRAGVECMGGGVTGGGYRGGFFNGGGESTKDSLLADLADYRSSKAAAFKEEMIRSVARAMKSQNFPIDPEADLDTISAQLRDNIERRRFSDEKKHTALCKAIATALNKQVTPGRKPEDSLIDTNAGAKSICLSVAEIVQGLTSGVHGEFLAVKAQVLAAMRNLAALHELMTRTQNKIDEKLMGDATAEVRREVEPLRDAHKRLAQHHDQVMLTLQGLLDTVILPADEELELLMAQQGDLYKALKKSKLVPGDAGFGEQISDVLTGLSVMSGMAARAQKALAVLGATMEQFVDSETWAGFRDGLDQAKLDDAANAGKIATAMHQLKQYFPDRRRIAQDAGSDIGRLGLGDNLASGDDDFTGGAEKTELDRRIEKRTLERKLILQQYFERTRAAYDKLLAATAKIGPRLGKDIPVTAALKSLQDALERMNNSADVRVDFNLIGYYSSAESRSQREQFINHLRLIDRALDDLVGGPGGELFSAMRAAIQDIHRIIEHYTEVVKTKFGGVPGGDAAGGAGGVVGGAMEDELRLAEAARSSIDLKSSVNEFVYFIRVAGVREQLAQSAKEIQEYGAKYSDVLGDAVADAIQAVRRERKTALKEEAGADRSESLGEIPVDGKALVAGGNNADANDVKAWEATKELIESEYKVKESFYQTLQAVDLYMKAFAAGIAAHPDEAANIKSMLDGVELIHKWYTDETGDQLYQFFEQARPLGGGLNDNSGVIDDATPGHYYEKVGSVINSGKQIASVGATSAAKAPKMNEALDQCMRRLQNLKNLMNAFIRIGAKFGGESLAAQTFIAPTEIWRRLETFIKASAISHGVVAGKAATIAGDPNAVQVPLAGAAATELEKMRAFCTVYPTPARPDGNGALRNCWRRELMFFQYMIKAIAAKILVVVGAFDLFERPEPIYEITPTRMILGGAGEPPEVIPGATELYFRLPRLAEFYYELFKFDYDDAAAAAKKISMLPELGGTFGGLISQVFIKARASASDGNYSESEVEGLVDAINTIYDRYKEHGGECCSRAIHGFVAEINRRYALIKKEEYKKYVETFTTEFRESSTGLVDDANGTNFAILPGEEVGGLTRESRRGLAPSARYLFADGDAAGTVPSIPGKFTLDTPNDPQNWNFLADFRDRLMDKLDGSEGVRKAYGKVSYTSVIDQAKRAIEAAQGDKRKQMEVVLRIVQGSELVSGTNQGRALIFHETVVLGLNTLTALTEQLQHFRQQVDDMDVVAMTTKLEAYIGKTAGGGGNITRANASNPANTGITVEQARYLIDDGQDFVQVADATNVGNSKSNVLGVFPSIPKMAGTAANLWTVLDNAGIAGGANEKFGAAAAARVAVNRSMVMRDLFVALFQLTCDFDNLVNVRFPGAVHSKISLDFSNLRSLVETLMGNVRYFLDAFRGAFDAATIQKFEGQTKDDYGSLRWLEHNLIQGLIKGQMDIGGAPRGDEITLEKLSQKVNAILLELTKEHDTIIDIANNQIIASDGQKRVVAPGAAAAPAANPIPPAALPAAKLDQYGRVFSSLAFWDAIALNSGIERAASQAGFPGVLGGLVRAERAPDSPPGTNNPFYKAAQGNAQIRRSLPLLTDPNQGINNNRSMLLVMNQLLVRYLEHFFDASSARIYQGLIDGFANGAFSQSLVNLANTQPDMTTNAAVAGGPVPSGPVPDFVQRGDPTSQAVLFTSTAVIMQRMMRDQLANGTSKHLVSTLAEVPTFMKESFRASLPIFSKLFALVLKEGEFMKEFIERCRVQCGRPTLAGATGAPAGSTGALTWNLTDGTAARGSPQANNTPAAPIEKVTMHPLGDAAANSHDSVKYHIFDVVSGVNNACFTLARIADDVVRELSDEPVYLETSDGSIQAYRSRYGIDPLMPESLIAFFLQQPAVPAAGANVPLDSMYSPKLAVGSPQFKMMYGLRGLFAPKGKIGLEQMPGAKAVLDSYNSGSTSRDKVEEGRFASLATAVAQTIRFIVNTRSYRAALVPSADSFTAKVIYNSPAGAGGAALAADVIDPKSVYALRTDVTREDQLLTIVDSSNQEDRIAGMTASLTETGAMGRGALSNKRDTERIYNIIDLNIMPINVHALMRSIALAPTMNYAYSFEELACAFLRQSRNKIKNVTISQPGTAPGAPGPKAPGDTKDFFLRLLVSPYEQAMREYFGDETNVRGTAGFGHRMFVGDNGLGMGRPKFLNDQVFNKALLGSTWPSKRDYDEMGPSGAISRGREGWGGPGTLPINVASATAVAANAQDVSDFMAACRELASNIDVVVTSFPQGVNSAGAPVDAASMAADLQLIRGAVGDAATGKTVIKESNDLHAVAAYSTLGLNGVDALLTTPSKSFLGPDATSGGTRLARIVESLDQTNLGANSNNAIAKALTGIGAAGGGYQFMRDAGVPELLVNFVADYANNLTHTGAARTLNALRGGGGNNAVDPRVIVAAIRGTDAATAQAALDAVPAPANWDVEVAKALAALGPAMSKMFLEPLVPIATRVRGIFQTQAGQSLVTGVSIMASDPTTPQILRADTVDQNMGTGDSFQLEGRILTYINSKGQDGAADIKEVAVGLANKRLLQAVGLDRFNTALVRNLCLVSNINRVMRSKLSFELAQQRTIIQRGSNIVASGMTEYDYSETSTSKDYFSDRSMVAQ